MALIAVALIAEDRCSAIPKQRPQCFQNLWMGLKVARILSPTRGPVQLLPLPWAEWVASNLAVKVINTSVLKRCLEGSLPKLWALTPSGGANIHEQLYLGGGERVAELYQGAALIPDAEDSHRYLNH